MHSVVVGIGRTGASCLRYLAKRGIPVSATDSRATPPGLADLGDLAGSLDLRLGGFDLSLLEDASQVLMSPGVSLDEPIARAARARGIEVLGDVELFARAVRAPVIGITGTNGKSTVTSLVARMATAAGRRVLAGGNLGEPALDLLEQPVPDLYVLELSSFQLETTSSLRLQAAVTELLVLLARERPFVLVLENWQWADPLSEELLSYLARNLAGAPLLVVITSRYAPDPLPEWAVSARGFNGRFANKWIMTLRGT